MALLAAFGFSLVLAAVISITIARKDGRNFSVPVFVVACIVLDMMAAPIPRKWQADWELQHTPLYQQIAKYDPETFQLIRQEVVEGAENRSSDAETSSRIAANGLVACRWNLPLLELSGRFVYAANIDSKNISIFSIGSDTGKLVAVGNVATTTSPGALYITTAIQ